MDKTNYNLDIQFLWPIKKPYLAQRCIVAIKDSNFKEALKIFKVIAVHLISKKQPLCDCRTKYLLLARGHGNDCSSGSWAQAFEVDRV